MMTFLRRKYGIEAFDYRRGKSAILVAAGTGLMLSIMDQCVPIRWCLDVDTLTVEQKARLPSWLQCVGNVTQFVAVAGWFSSTNPKPLAEAVSALRPSKVVCYVQFHGVGADPFLNLRTANTLAEFLEQVKER